jgi:hypothetical protein
MKNYRIRKNEERERTHRYFGTMIDDYDGDEDDIEKLKIWREKLGI